MVEYNHVRPRFRPKTPRFVPIRVDFALISAAHCSSGRRSGADFAGQRLARGRHGTIQGRGVLRAHELRAAKTPGEGGDCEVLCRIAFRRSSGAITLRPKRLRHAGISQFCCGTTSSLASVRSGAYDLIHGSVRTLRARTSGRSSRGRSPPSKGNESPVGAAGQDPARASREG